MGLSWGDLVTRRLTELMISQAELARRVRRPTGYVSQVVRGLKHPPETNIAMWADALELPQSDRDRFYLIADLERSPERVRQYVYSRIVSDLSL